jgi:hypothetical protein
MLAVNLAYKDWVGNGAAPDPASFTAIADASNDPFVITFSPAPGYTIRGGHFTIPASQVVDPRFGEIPMAHRAPVGPLSLTGFDVRAIDAVETYRANNPPKSKASLEATGTWVALSVLGGTYYVDWEQQPAGRVAGTTIGCDPAESYIVNRTTLAVRPATPACPA